MYGSDTRFSARARLILLNLWRGKFHGGALGPCPKVSQGEPAEVSKVSEVRPSAGPGSHNLSTAGHGWGLRQHMQS